MNKTDAEFKRRADAIPRNRYAENIRELKQLVKEMYEADYGVAEIGRILKRDHTTIVHHLHLSGFRPQEENRIKNASFYEYRLAEEKRKTEMREAYDASYKKICEERAKRSILHQHRLEQTKKDKETALSMWKKGEKLVAIAEKLSSSIQRVHYLLHYGGKAEKRSANIMVQKFSLDGRPIKTYKSIREAARDVGCKADAIGHAVNDRRYIQAAGFVWRRVEPKP